MKKFLALSFLTVGAAALVSADTITILCPTTGGSGAAGTSTATCNAASSPSGFSSLDSIVLTFKFDADFGIGAGSVMESFDVLPAGAGDAFGGELDHPTGQLVTGTVRGIVGTFTILNPTITEVNAALGALQIADTWSSGTGSFFNAAFDYQLDVNYTPDRTVPEPRNLGLLSGAMLGMSFLARRKLNLRSTRT